jgi:hypothetical protein
MKIEGPISLTEMYNFKTKKWVYIFGDYHVLDGKCTGKRKMNINAFLKYTLNQNKDKVIDLFVEGIKIDKYTTMSAVNYLNRDDIVAQNNIHLVSKEFLACNRQLPEKYDCPYENLRFHNIDSEYRYDIYPDDDTSFVPYVFELMYDLNMYKLMSPSDRPRVLKRIKNNVLVRNNIVENYDEFVKYIFNTQVLEDFKIKKQLMSVDPAIRKVLIKKTRACMKLEYDEWIDEYVEYKNKLFDKKRKSEYEYENITYKMQSVIDFTRSCIPDLYFLARLFRKFDTSKERNSAFPDSVNNAIVYAGNAHARNVSRILMDLGFRVINYTYNVGQCIDVSKFDIPFFQTIPDPDSRKIYENEIYKKIIDTNNKNFEFDISSLPKKDKKKKSPRKSSCKKGYERYPDNESGRCLKICGSKQYRSPETRRCRKIKT